MFPKPPYLYSVAVQICSSRSSRDTLMYFPGHVIRRIKNGGEFQTRVLAQIVFGPYFNSFTFLYGGPTVFREPSRNVI